MTSKKMTRVKRGGGGHWVGDGFPVSTMFSYFEDGAEISPFLLLDHAGPADFEPADKPRGVEKHPHRGFETVTIVYQGEVEHKDSAGNAGKSGPGDVQWMTAARGILHEEMHGMEFTRKGGTLEMIQLWVNLPARYKMRDPGYQEILNRSIPVADLPNGAGHMRLIAGEYGDVRGAAKTFTPLNLWDMRVKAGSSVTLPVADGHNAMLLVLSGRISVEGEGVNGREIVHFTQGGDAISFDVRKDAVILLMSGEPIDEPVVGRGPFVMNTAEEIRAAMNDYAAGRF
ncbi:MAG TPA: pirin family protein [Micavibrio sp.]|nr:pirin family protein [Micavibrio sp.]